MARKPSEHPHVYGPYKHGGGYRLIVSGEGKRVATEVRPSFEEAAREKIALERRLAEQAGRTVGLALGEYRQHLLQKNRPKSVATTMTRLRHFFPDEALPLPRLSVREAQRLYELRRAGKAVDTHRNELAEAKTFIGWCVKQGMLRHNPFITVEGIGNRKRGKDQLTIDESRLLAEAALTRAALGDLGALAVAVLVYTGLRASELTNLRVRDLDDGGRLLRVQPAIGQADHLKSRSARRAIALPPHLRELLGARVKDRPRDALVFGQHDRTWPNEQTRRICELCGVPRVTAHGLRGGAATMSTLSMQDENAVAKTFGHSSATTTRAHYIEPQALADLQQSRITSVLDRTNPPEPLTDDATGEGHSAVITPDSVTKALPADEAGSHE